MTGRARVAVNACIIGEHPTGLGLYTIKLIRALDGLRDDLVVYTSAPATLDGLRALVVPVTAGERTQFAAEGGSDAGRGGIQWSSTRSPRRSSTARSRRSRWSTTSCRSPFPRSTRGSSITSATSCRAPCASRAG